jgi:hypothetical protein
MGACIHLIRKLGACQAIQPAEDTGVGNFKCTLYRSNEYISLRSARFVVEMCALLHVEYKMKKQLVVGLLSIGPNQTLRHHSNFLKFCGLATFGPRSLL